MGELFVKVTQDHLNLSLDLNNVERLLLKAAQPLIMSGSLTAGAITLDALRLQLGISQSQSASLITKRNGLKVKANSINGAFADLDSASNLVLEAEDINLNDFDSNIARFKAVNILKITGDRINIHHPDNCLQGARKQISGSDVKYQAGTFNLANLEHSQGASVVVNSNAVYGATDAAEIDLSAISGLKILTNSFSLPKPLWLNDADITVSETGYYQNIGGIHTSGNLTLKVAAPAGPLEVAGSLDLPKQTHPSYERPLTDLSVVTCQGITTMEGAAVNQTSELDLSNLHHLNLKTPSFYLTNKLTTQAIEVETPGDIAIGQDQNNFGQIITSRGVLHLHGNTVFGKFAKLTSKGDLIVKAKESLDLGHFVKRSPDPTKYLGPSGGNAVDDEFTPTGDNTYNGPNGSALVAGRELSLTSPKMNVDYLKLFSNDKTTLTTTSNLRMINTDFLGLGGLAIESPSIIFDFEGIGRGYWAPNIFDYLLSLPSMIQHVGDIHLTSPHVQFIGTSICAHSMFINGTAYSNNIPHKVILTPIALGVVNIYKRLLTDSAGNTWPSLQGMDFGFSIINNKSPQRTLYQATFRFLKHIISTSRRYYQSTDISSIRPWQTAQQLPRLWCFQQFPTIGVAKTLRCKLHHSITI